MAPNSDNDTQDNRYENQSSAEIKPLPNIQPAVVSKRPANNKKILIALAVLIALAAAGVFYWTTKDNNKTKKASVTAAKVTKTAQTNTPKTEGLVLDESKNYGNKYANGILPVGDGKYDSTTAKAGSVYVCAGYANNLKSAQGGAGSRGPWFVGTTQYDLNKKAKVRGAVKWQAAFSNKVSGDTRTIVTNDLPTHTTGVFPISPADPAYAYDRNPNSIKGQSLTYALTSDPAYGSPNCIGGEAGVMLTGVSLFNGFDAGGRDAGAWEVQDSCSGHPQKEGEYHYHTLSSCITDISVKTVIGFALDGFPITGPSVGDNNFLTTTDLDECHGLSSKVILDGKQSLTYHYVMTQDFPYSVSCFRAKPIQPPNQPAARP